MLKAVSSAIVAFVAIFYIYLYVDGNRNDQKKLQNVLDGLLHAEQSVKLSTDLPVAVGFGSCLDLIVDGVALLNTSFQPPQSSKYHHTINSAEDLAEMFAFFMEQGAAAERFIPLDLLKKLVSVGENLPNARWAGGGNAPVMSKRFAKDGFTNIIVGSQASQKFKAHFPDTLKFVDTANDGDDDVHLILEYKVGETWGKYTAVRANRFVVHSDRNNPYIKSLESFHDEIRNVQPRLVIVSALQMLDNFPFENNNIRDERLIGLQQMLHSIPQETLLHFEMASFGEVAMMRSLLKYVFPYVDSLGMNEQELPNIVSMLQNDDIIEVADSNPRTALVLDDIRSVYKHYKQHSIRQLTRIHVHTLSFQAILTVKGKRWKNSKAGSARASLTAHRHVCAVDDITIKKARLIMDDSFSLSAKSEERIYFNETSPISCWDEDDYEICVAPVLVCTDVKQTIGGGDNITPAGLMPQM